MPPAKVEKPRDPLATLRISRTEPPRSSRKRGRWLRRFLVACVLLALVAGSLVAASRQGWLEVPESLQPRLEVQVARVSVRTGRAGDAVVVATGYLESQRQANIGARAPGRIQTLNVEEGSRVEKGQVLAALEHADLDAALAANQAELKRTQAQVAEQKVEIKRTQREYDRAVKLRPSRAMTEADFDQARFQHEAALAKIESLKAAIALAEARVREAEQIKENMFVRAPFDGTIISKDAEVGESILPGGMGEGSGRGSVVTIADLDHLEVDCDVKEDYISRVVVGQPAEVAVDAVPDRRYRGSVRKVIPMGDRARATIKVKVEILDSDQRLFPDMSGTVYFLPDETEPAEKIAERRIFCPTDAVVTDGQASHVWRVDDHDRLQRVDVKIGDGDDRHAEILAGLDGGEQVVMRPPDDLQNEQLVKISE